MRHELTPLENKLVLIQGWFKEYRKQNDSAHLLLSNTHVHEMNPNTAYMKSPPLFILDHLWVTESGAENTKGRELFTKQFFVGRVKPYIRTNKSKDYGVVGEHFQDLDKILYQVSWKLKQIEQKPARQSIKHKTVMQLYCKYLLQQYRFAPIQIYLYPKPNLIFHPENHHLVSYQTHQQSL